MRNSLGTIEYGNRFPDTVVRRTFTDQQYVDKSLRSYLRPYLHCLCGWFPNKIMLVYLSFCGWKRRTTHSDSSALPLLPGRSRITACVRPVKTLDATVLHYINLKVADENLWAASVHNQAFHIQCRTAIYIVLPEEIFHWSCSVFV